MAVADRRGRAAGGGVRAVSKRQVPHRVVLDQERARGAHRGQHVGAAARARAPPRAGWRTSAGSRRAGRPRRRAHRRAGRAGCRRSSLGTGTRDEPGGAGGGERAEVRRRLDDHGGAGRGQTAQAGGQRRLAAADHDDVLRGRGRRRARPRAGSAAARAPPQAPDPTRPAGARARPSACTSAPRGWRLLGAGSPVESTSTPAGGVRNSCLQRPRVELARPERDGLPPVVG